MSHPPAGGQANGINKASDVFFYHNELAGKTFGIFANSSSTDCFHPCFPQADGLKVKATEDKTMYEKGSKVPDEELKNIRLHREDFHEEWNYLISPDL